MLYRAIGLMSGSSLDGLDIAFVELHEDRGLWSFDVPAAACYPYSEEWSARLQSAVDLPAGDYLLLHSDYGHYLGQQVNRFIAEKDLHYKVGLIASHGHTVFHLPARGMTAQLGDGAAIAAETGLPVVSDLRSLDIAFGGQGAPIVPMGERLLFRDYSLFLNIGGIANISFNGAGVAFDVCPANRVLNLLAAGEGKLFDDGGAIAASGEINEKLLGRLNALDYYQRPYPKSLANSFGTEEVLPLVRSFGLSTADSLRTYVEHIAYQVGRAVASSGHKDQELLVTGGGAFNRFLIERLSQELQRFGIGVVVPDGSIVSYKEALIMALIGVLRWRQEYNVLSSVTGARRDSIGGAVWIGQEA